MPNDATSQGHNLTISWEVADDVTLKSLTGYRKLSSITNQNYLTGVVGPFPLILTGFDQKQDQWSEEVQLVGSALDRRLDYVLGAYYFDENGESADYSAITGRPRMDRVSMARQPFVRLLRRGFT
jgi:iron complex outermembrane receptor protein